jgi:hypothetical protein
MLGIFDWIPIKVHCWGGLGSQLFAYITANRLATLFPSRRISLILHSSGVTPRRLELPETLHARFQIRFQDDFDESKAAAFDSQSRPQSTLKNLVKNILSALGLLANLNSQSDYSKIRPWIVTVRGHYTEIVLTRSEVLWLMRSLAIPDSNFGEHDPSTLNIHLRLGDLLTLRSKTHIPSDRISEAIRSQSSITSIDIYSDGEAKEITEVLGQIVQDYRFGMHNFSVLEVIKQNCVAINFLGTNSKISLWIAIFRIFNDKSSLTLLPSETFSQLSILASGLELNDTFRSY